MTDPRFIQIHTLTSYPASLLNRDDVGFAKRMPFGGETRTRISSQCLKRHWRTFDGEDRLAPAEDLSIRSRQTFQRYVVEPLLGDGVNVAVVRAVTEAIMAEVLGESAKAKKAKEDSEEGDSLQTGQIVVLGRPEVDFMLSLARGVCAGVDDPKQAKDAVKKALTKEAKENLRALRRAAGLDAALFGRMVTSDILARGDAAVHVAHAFTVHAEATESDYFSAVDDLLAGDEELGSGHIGSTELTSGLFYGYVVVDVPLLVSNLEGCKRADWRGADRGLAGKVVERLIHLITKVSPGAKLGSTAPYSYAHMALLEVGNAQPRTLANSFLDPVRGRGDLVKRAYGELAGHLGELDRMYGPVTERRVAALGPVELLQTVAEQQEGGVPGLAAWAGGVVRGR